MAKFLGMWAILALIILPASSFQPSGALRRTTFLQFTPERPYKEPANDVEDSMPIDASTTASSLKQYTTNSSPQKSSSSNNFRYSSKRVQHRDIAIVGGGLAGLSAALYVSQIDPSRHVTILEREDTSSTKTTVASMAAAGMLAPNAERLPQGDLLDLCLASRRMYADFVEMVESLAQQVGSEGEHFLSPDDDQADLPPWDVGYVGSGGFLAPAFAGDAVASWAPPEGASTARWLDTIQVRELEPNLHPDVVGGWWFPEDASVDTRRLTRSLRAACVASGVQILCGKDHEVSSLDLAEGRCQGLWTLGGKYMQANAVLIANGAWMRSLLPVPLEPHKGQSISLRMPPNQPSPLRRVLFAQDSYIVPKADGRIVVGATVEAGSFDPNVTPAGLMHILTHALQLVPALKDLPVEESWVGLRPTTPDKGPILGRTQWSNLYLAGGYWRNGVLLAPKTGQLLAALLCGLELSSSDSRLLDAFSWERFMSKEGSAKMAANSRYAASMHPIHGRKSGVGVAASVGTELGSYASARAAVEERKKDRGSFWDESSNDEKEFERAAALGRQDASAFTVDVEEKREARRLGAVSSKPRGTRSLNPLGFQPIPPLQRGITNVSPKAPSNRVDADVAVDEEESSASTASDSSSEAPAAANGATLEAKELSKKDLSAVYAQISANKKAATPSMSTEEDDSEPAENELPDPGFRISWVDPETNEEHEVPPYTSPGEFLSQIKEQKRQLAGDESLAREAVAPNGEQYTEKTYDGYTAIQDQHSNNSRAEQLELMREARIKNRVGQASVDESLLGEL